MKFWASTAWSAPAGNAAISGFRIARDGADSTGGGAYATTLAASARTFTFTLLRPDATYRFSVQATNGAGPGATAVTSEPAMTVRSTTCRWRKRHCWKRSSMSTNSSHAS